MGASRGGRACVRDLVVTDRKRTPLIAAGGAERVGLKVEDTETLKTHPAFHKTCLALRLMNLFIPTERTHALPITTGFSHPLRSLPQGLSSGRLSGSGCQPSSTASRWPTALRSGRRSTAWAARYVRAHVGEGAGWVTSSTLRRPFVREDRIQRSGPHRTATVRVQPCGRIAPELTVFRAADVDPAVFQRLFLVVLFLRRGRFPGGENICGNQVSRASPSVYHSSLSPPQLRRRSPVTHIHTRGHTRSCSVL